MTVKLTIRIRLKNKDKLFKLYKSQLTYPYQYYCYYCYASDLGLIRILFIIFVLKFMEPEAKVKLQSNLY